MKLDVLIFAAHPDDAELSMGGTIAKLTKNHFNVGITDLTQGELGTRGNIQTRKVEAKKASKVLNIIVRNNLRISDGNILIDQKNIIKIIKEIRKYQPKIIFAPYFNDRHPDHISASNLVKKAMFFSGLTKIKTFDGKKKQDSFRPSKLYYYMQTYSFEPSFIVDISETFELKMRAMKCYETQFFIEGKELSEPQTFISDPKFISYLEARSRYYGFRIGKEYGEPFFSEESIELDFLNLIKGI